MQQTYGSHNFTYRLICPVTSPVEIMLVDGCESTVKSNSFSGPVPVSNFIVQGESSIAMQLDHKSNHRPIQQLLPFDDCVSGYQL